MKLSCFLEFNKAEDNSSLYNYVKGEKYKLKLDEKLTEIFENMNVVMKILINFYYFLENESIPTNISIVWVNVM